MPVRRGRRQSGIVQPGAQTLPGQGRGQEPASSPAHFRVTLNNLQFVGFSGGRGRPTRNPNAARRAIREGAWAVMTGGNPSTDPRRYHEGGSPVEEVAGAPPTVDDVTISRPFRVDRDWELWKWAFNATGRARGNLSITPLDGDYNSRGSPAIYTNALLTGCSKPDIDADATGDVARLELTFAVAGQLG